MENDPITESLVEFYDWINSLSVQEQEIAIAGLSEYAQEIMQEINIVQGRTRYINE